MRVLVGRAAHQAEATATALAGAGHAPVLAPILAILSTDVPPPAAMPDALLVTSRNAVAPLARHRDAFPDIPIFAVGPRTAAALAAARFDGVSATAGDGTDLARMVRSAMPSGTRLLHVAGRERRPEPAASLVAAGYAVETWEAYAAEPAATLPLAARDALRAGELDAVLHYSPRSAALLQSLAAEAGLAAPFAALRHLCLSANVAAALADVRSDRIAVAPAPDETSLLALIETLDRAD